MSAEGTHGAPSMRTPLGRVRYLGASHSGTGDFWRQRLTAVAMTLLIIPVIVIVMMLLGRNQAGAAAILGSIPIVVLGLLFKNQIETVFRSLWIVAGTLIVFGILLGVADLLGRRTLRLRDMTIPHAVFYGLAQSLALVPGVSRSGATIALGRALGYERPAAARYSFLLALPAVFGSGFYELYDSLEHRSPMVFDWAQTGVATVVAGVVGFGVIAFLMRYISKGSFIPFVVYRVVIGVVIIVLLVTGVLKAQ